MNRCSVHMLGCAMILFVCEHVNDCSAATPPELLEIISRWKKTCFEKEFKATGNAIQGIDNLQKDPFGGKDENELYRMHSTVRFYENGIVLKGSEVGPGEKLDDRFAGHSVWLNGRTTYHHFNSSNKEEVVVVDIPDPKGAMIPSPSGTMLAGCGLVRNSTIEDLFDFYETWEPIKSSATSKLFRGKSANGTIDVVVETTSQPHITHLVGSLRFRRPNDGLPIKIEFDVTYRYENASPNELIPTFVESRKITTGKGINFGAACRFSLSSSIGKAKPLVTLADGLPEIANGTRVQVDDFSGIEFEWRDREIVRKIDRKKVASLIGFKFTGVKWLLPGILLFLTGAVGFVWWRRSCAQ